MKKTIKKSSTILLLSLAAILELGMLTFLKGEFGIRASALVLLLSGLFVGIRPLFFLYKKEYSFPISREISSSKILLIFVCMLLGTGSCAYLLHQEIQALPITDFYNAEGSDVIPQIGIMVDRFLSGEFPYQLITEWSFQHQLYPTYLPLTWMPYILPDSINLDYRWFAFISLVGIIFLFSKSLAKAKLDPLAMALMILLPFFFLFAFLCYDDEGLFKYSVESLITTYYLAVGLSLTTKSNKLRAVAILFCLLSRYSLVLWLPLFFFLIFLKEGTKNVLQIATFILIGLLAIYGPFLWIDSMIYLRGYEYHSLAALNIWNLAPWQSEGELPHSLYKGLGFCWLFYEYWDGTLLEKLNAYKTLHLALSVMTPVIFGMIFWKIKNHINYQIFLLCSLKVYLVVFYNFIQIPFSYLFLVPIFLSVPIIGFLVCAKIED